jgi:hypothetical protein
MSQSEQELTRAIIDRLNAIPGVWAWRTNTGVAKMPGGRVRFGLVGGGDITGILLGGRHFEVEVKLPGGKWPVTPQQEKHGTRVQEMGGLWFVARSVDEAVRTVVDELGCSKCNTTGDRNWNDPGACSADPCDCHFARRSA